MRRSRLRRDQRGFTLIELLVVVLIVGVLAAIAIPSFLAQATGAKDAVAKDQARTAQMAAEVLATESDGSYGASALGRSSSSSRFSATPPPRH